VQTFMVYSRDNYQNLITDGNQIFTAELIDEQNTRPPVPASVTSHGDGTYLVLYETQYANTYDYVQVYLHASGGLMGSYFLDYYFQTVDPAGKEIIEETINFDWKYGGPYDGFQLADYFSAAWEGFISAPHTETYTIYASVSANSGVRVTINNENVLDAFEPEQGILELHGTFPFVKNTLFPITVEFREKTGEAKLVLQWSSFSNEKEIIPSTSLYYKKAIAIDGASQRFYVNIVPNNTVAEASQVLNTFENAFAGEMQSFEVQAKDAFDNNQTDAGNEQLSFTAVVSLEGEDDSVFSCFDLNGGLDGMYKCNVYGHITEEHTVLVNFDGEEINGSPFHFQVNPTNATASTSSTYVYSGIAGEVYTAKITIRDVYGNLCECKAEDINLNVSFVHTTGYEADIVSITEVSGGLGRWDVAYNCSKSGWYTPLIFVNNETISNVNASFYMEPADAVASTSSLVYPLQEFVAGLTSGIVVQLRDRFYNQLTWNGGYELYATFDNNNGAVYRGSTSSLIDGMYRVNFTLPAPGQYLMTIKLASGVRAAPDGLLGTYFSNRWLYGESVMTRVDPRVEFYWADGVITETDSDYVSVRWTGYIKAPSAETYTFTITSDDGANLLVDQMVVVNEFYSGSGVYEGSFTFNEVGLLHTIVIEWRENEGTANIKLEMQSDTAYPTKIVVPQSILFSNATNVDGSPKTITVV